MPERDPNVIDGFASVQALKRVSARSAIKQRVHDSDGVELPEQEPVADGAGTANAAAPFVKAAARVAVPTKRLVICYACGYSHTASGQMHNPYCPKCKTKLNAENVTVNGKRTEDILTIGNVVILPEAELAPGLSITGQNIILDGDATSLASLTATELIELRTNAKFNGETLHNRTGKVVIAADHAVALETPFTCNELEVRGMLNAKVSVTQSAHLYEGSLLEGSFHGPILCVDDGAGLIADVDLSPLYRPEPEKPKGKTVRKVASALANFIFLGLSLFSSVVCCIATL